MGSISAKVVDEEENMGKNSGLAKSGMSPNGRRRVLDGKERAPKSLWRKGRMYLSDCSDAELKTAGVARVWPPA